MFSSGLESSKQVSTRINSIVRKKQIPAYHRNPCFISLTTGKRLRRLGVIHAVLQLCLGCLLGVLQGINGTDKFVSCLVLDPHKLSPSFGFRYFCHVPLLFLLIQSNSDPLPTTTTNRLMLVNKN